jgi:hypothetical protein
MNVHRGSYLDLEMPIFVKIFQIYVSYTPFKQEQEHKNTNFNIPRPENTRIVVVVNTAPANIDINSAILHYTYQFGNFKCTVKQAFFLAEIVSSFPHLPVCFP